MTTPDEDEGSSGLMFFRLKSLGLRTMWIGWCPSQNGIKPSSHYLRAHLANTCTECQYMEVTGRGSQMQFMALAAPC